MFESADAEIVILGCILFLKEFKVNDEFPGQKDVNTSFHKQKSIPNMSKKDCVIVNEEKDAAILLYCGMSHFTINFKQTKELYKYIFNGLETINI